MTHNFNVDPQINQIPNPDLGEPSFVQSAMNRAHSVVSSVHEALTPRKFMAITMVGGVAVMGGVVAPRTSAEDVTKYTPTPPTLADCEKRALHFPGNLRAGYIKHNDTEDRYVRSTTTLPDMSDCSALGKRVLKLKMIWVQGGESTASHTDTSFHRALRRPVWLASGDGQKTVNKITHTTRGMSCRNTNSTRDGVNIAKADYIVSFRPTGDSSTVRKKKTIRVYNPNIC